MIKITKEQPLYKYIKRQVFEQTATGYKRFAKKHYEDLELVWDDFAKRMKLIYQDRYFIPQQLHNKNKAEKFDDLQTKRFIEREKESEK
nr:MAG TPA: hypothetical protein [Caudoviricetes sp.]